MAVANKVFFITPLDIIARRNGPARSKRAKHWQLTRNIP